VFLLHGVIGFRFASFIAFENTFGEYALVLRHKSLSAGNKLSDFHVCGKI
jgi:hypothetical protein